MSVLLNSFQLQGTIDDCSCNIDTVDYYNNVKIYPRLQSLLVKDFFRYYKVHLNKECPFWVDDSKCAMRFCHVEHCEEKDIPPGLKGDASSYHKVSEREVIITRCAIKTCQPRGRTHVATRVCYRWHMVLVGVFPLGLY